MSVVGGHKTIDETLRMTMSNVGGDKKVNQSIRYTDIKTGQLRTRIVRLSLQKTIIIFFK